MGVTSRSVRSHFGIGLVLAFRQISRALLRCAFIRSMGVGVLMWEWLGLSIVIKKKREEMSVERGSADTAPFVDRLGAGDALIPLFCS
jgi:hypothetical protein